MIYILILLLIMSNRKCICLICKNCAVMAKKHNLKRNFLTETDLCVDISPKLQKALHHVVQPPATRQVEGGLSIPSLFIPLPIRTWPPGAIHITATAHMDR